MKTQSKINDIIIFTTILIISICLSSIITLKYNINQQEDKLELQERQIDSLKQVQYRNESDLGNGLRGYDFVNKNKYIPYPSDEEIRLMRENNPDLIIKAPGRQIKSRRELFEKQIEDYIDENPDVIDQYVD